MPDRLVPVALLTTTLLACGDGGGTVPTPDTVSPDTSGGPSADGTGVVQTVASNLPLSPPAPARPAPPGPSYLLGGTVSGLVGRGLVLESAAGETLPIARDGRFAFVARVPAGFPYAVRIKTQPSVPAQRCGVSTGGGVANADVTSVRIVCQRQEPLVPIGASVRGLVGRGLVVQNGGRDDVSVAGNGPLTFPTSLPSGAAYDVTVSQQPRNPSQTCAVANGKGDVSDAPVMTPVITCTTNAYALGGFVSGLEGTLGLSLVDGTFVQVSSTGPFAFPRKLPSGADYFVSITSSPPSQNCRIVGERGAIGEADVHGIVVNCDQSWRTLAATVSGLTGNGLALENDLGEVIPVSADGSYAFTTPRAGGMPYAIHVKRQPSYPHQVCTIEGGAGVIGDHDIVASVTCVVPPTVDLFVGHYYDPVIDVFRSDDDGDVAPRRRIGGPSTQIGWIRSLTVSGPELFVGNSYPASVLVFDKAASGDVAPVRAITGPSTGLNEVTSVDVVGNEIFAVSYDRVSVFDKNAVGDAAPLRVIEGFNEHLEYPMGLRVIGEELFVTDYSRQRVNVYPRTALGAAAPTRTLPVPLNPSSVVPVGDDEIFVAALVGYGPTVGVVIHAQTGALLRTIQTPFIDGHIHSECAFRAGTLACASAIYPASVLFFNGNTDGEVPPVRRIEGPNTMFSFFGPMGVAYDN